MRVWIYTITAYIHQLKEFMTKAGLQDRVHFLHGIPSDDLPAIYQSAETFDIDFLIIPYIIVSMQIEVLIQIRITFLFHNQIKSENAVCVF